MNEEKGKDWKLQVIDALDEFATRTGPRLEEPAKVLLEDEGQENLFWDAMKQIFTTCRFKRGDELTALELGRLFGHWTALWQVLIGSESYRQLLTESHTLIVSVVEKLNVVVAGHQPEALCGVETGPLHLLAAVNDPCFIDRAIEKTREYDALCKGVMAFAARQKAAERESFFAGYGEAIAADSMDENGRPKVENKFATMLAYFRPFAIRAGMSAADFQSVMDYFLGTQSVGNPERFVKHLQRRKAQLRSKGRPLKKICSGIKGVLGKIGQIILPRVRFVQG